MHSDQGDVLFLEEKERETQADRGGEREGGKGQITTQERVERGRGRSAVTSLFHPVPMCEMLNTGRRNEQAC